MYKLLSCFNSVYYLKIFHWVRMSERVGRMSWWKSRDKQVKKIIFKVKQKQEYKPSQNTIVHFTNDFASNLELIKQQIGHNSDVRFRKFNIGRTDIQAGIVFVDGLSDKEIIDKHIMKLLMDDFSDEYKMNLLMWSGLFQKNILK